MVQEAGQDEFLQEEVGEGVSFNIGDMVWCIDPNNNNGRYTITYYHRPCKVVKVRKDEIRVEVLDENDSEVNGLEFWVDGRFFQRVKSKAQVV